MAWISQTNKAAFRNPWVLWWLAGLLLVLSVNTAFIITAVVTNPGLVEKDYYEQGRNHEQTVQQKLATRKELGWEMTLEIIKNPVQGEESLVSFYLRDKQGEPLLVDGVALNVYRPSSAALDFATGMTAVANGEYQARIIFSERGVWELTAVAVEGEDRLDTTLRLVVAPASDS
ncbi:hypothetical protein D5085_11900 [Ectothiorhodospiraceae bacterium BW-2]|nr:hypothetical protein D5085_11900 [Ectothiorhodospiraceae bacterium BW-2]